MDKTQLNVTENCDKNNSFPLGSQVGSLDIRRYSINGILSSETESSLTGGQTLQDTDATAANFVDRFIGKLISSEYFYLHQFYVCHS